MAFFQQQLTRIIAIGGICILPAFVTQAQSVRARIRGPQQTIESVKETRSALTPGQDKSSAPALHSAQGGTPADPSGW